MKLMATVREKIKTFKGKDFSAQEVAEAAVTVGVRQVYGCFCQLLDRGEIERTAYGRYRAVSQFIPYVGSKKLRIFRAMHVKGTFTAREIAVLSGANIRYVYNVINALTESRELEKIGAKKSIKKKLEAVFRVCTKDKFYLKYVIRQITENKFH